MEMVSDDIWSNLGDIWLFPNIHTIGHDARHFVNTSVQCIGISMRMASHEFLLQHPKTLHIHISQHKPYAFPKRLGNFTPNVFSN